MLGLNIDYRYINDKNYLNMIKCIVYIIELEMLRE